MRIEEENSLYRIKTYLIKENIVASISQNTITIIRLNDTPRPFLKYKVPRWLIKNLNLSFPEFNFKYHKGVIVFERKKSF